MILGVVSAYKGEETLEDFNVRVLFDKLEDQNLHLASQLARHQEDLRGFYDRICNQNDDLKGMLNDLDTDKLERLISQREAEGGQSHDGQHGAARGSGGPNVVNTNVTLGGRLCCKPSHCYTLFIYLKAKITLTRKPSLVVLSCGN